MSHENKSRKTLQQLAFKDNFMFAAVMLDEENAKGLLERALSIKINRVEISTEKSIVYNPEYKGVRLDVYLQDDIDRHFNVEMQVANKKIAKRARYYHSQVDMELLGTGIDYEELPTAYVIFICDFDPFGLKKFRYTVKYTFAENQNYTYDDGSHTIILSTKGENENEEPKDLVNFLKYAGSDSGDSQDDYEDEFVQRLQKSVVKIKSDREMGRRFMLFEEIRKEEYKAGKAEGMLKSKKDDILTLLNEISPISESLKEKIESITSLEVLTQLIKKAAKAESVEAFQDALDSMNL